MARDEFRQGKLIQCVRELRDGAPIELSRGFVENEQSLE
jgi:hypothetical protein